MKERTSDEAVTTTEQTSAPKTQAGSARGATSAAKQEAGADSAAPSAAKVSAQAAAQPGDHAAEGGPQRGSPGHFGGEAGDRNDFGAEDAAPRPAGCGGAREAGCTAAADRNFGSEGERRDRPRHSGGVKREVWRRDRGRCSYVDRTSGRRCRSQHLLQIDHVVPYARGGAAEPNNLRLLCAAHHRYRHAGARFGRPPRRGSSISGPISRWSAEDECCHRCAPVVSRA